MLETISNVTGGETNSTISTAVSETVANATSGSTLGNMINADPIANFIETHVSSYIGLGPFISDVIAALVILTIFLMLSELAKIFVTNIAPHLVAKTGSSLDDEILAAIKGPIQVLIIVIGIYLACKTFNNLSLGVVNILDMLATIALILIGAYLVSNLVKALIRWYIKDIAPRTDSDLDDHLLPFMGKFIVATIYVLALLMILSSVFGVKITPLLAGLGIGGIAIALAAQESLSNLFGAIAILIDRPYKVGDRLILENIGQGDVVEVGLRSTRIRTLDNRIVVIPNEDIAGNKIINMSQPDSKIRILLKIGIGYKSDVDRACAILEDIATSNPRVAKDPKPRAYVSALGNFAVEITLLVYLTSYRDDLRVPDEIYRQILQRFKQEDIDIPYPTMTIMPKQNM